MISSIKGILTLKSPTRIEVDVQGIGYGLMIPVTTFDRLPEAGQSVHLSTYMLVREDEISLYGFHSSAEKEMFLSLISVSGVGPKIGIAFLSALSEKEIHKAILEGNVSILTAVPGVGKKTAERIVLDLKDKLRKKGMIDLSKIRGSQKEESRKIEDAVSALVTLGYSFNDSRKSIAAILQEKGETISIENLIREGLARLVR